MLVVMHGTNTFLFTDEIVRICNVYLLRLDTQAAYLKQVLFFTLYEIH